MENKKCSKPPTSIQKATKIWISAKADFTKKNGGTSRILSNAGHDRLHTNSNHSSTAIIPKCFIGHRAASQGSAKPGDPFSPLYNWYISYITIG